MKLNNHNKIGSGVECIVYDIGNGRVPKKYKDEEKAKNAYDRAAIAAEHKIGPGVYGLFKNIYITEKVEVISCNCSEERRENCKVKNINSFFHSLTNELVETAMEIFGDSVEEDIHIGNFGIKDNKFVLIDFGDVSYGELPYETF